MERDVEGSQLVERGGSFGKERVTEVRLEKPGLLSL
jgi:hypothetical protein